MLYSIVPFRLFIGHHTQEYARTYERGEAQTNAGPLQQNAATGATTEASGGMTLSLKQSNTTSAPTSPAKGVSSFLSRATSLTGSVTSTVQQIARATTQAAAAIKERHKILLVIDDHLIDWYDRRRRCHSITDSHR